MSELNIKQRILKLLTFFALGIISLSSVFAYRVEPLVATLEPSGSGSMMRLVITNTNSTPLIVELNALRVETTSKGEVVREDELKDLLIFPAQTSIPPGREQVVQVRYVGDQKLDDGRVYAVRISQLPVSTGQTNSGGSEVKLGVNFLSHILVQNKGVAAEVVISDINKNSDGSLSFIAENTGKGTALLREANWSLTDASGKTIPISTEYLDTGSFGALISGAPKRSIKINADAIQGLSGEIEVTMQAK